MSIDFLNQGGAGEFFGGWGEGLDQRTGFGPVDFVVPDGLAPVNGKLHERCLVEDATRHLHHRRPLTESDGIRRLCLQDFDLQGVPVLGQPRLPQLNGMPELPYPLAHFSLVSR